MVTHFYNSVGTNIWESLRAKYNESQWTIVTHSRGKYSGIDSVKYFIKLG